MRSNATTPTAYLAALPAERRLVVSQLRDTLSANLPKGFEEQMSYGMLGFVVPRLLCPGGFQSSVARP